MDIEDEVDMYDEDDFPDEADEVDIYDESGNRVYTDNWDVED